MRSNAWILSIPKSNIEANYIENESLRQIQTLVPQGSWSEGEWRIVCRMVHTCGDPSIAKDIQFFNGAVESGIRALRNGSKIYVDSQMQKAGISAAKIKSVQPNFEKDSILCHVADSDVARQAKEYSMARSLFAIRKARSSIHGGIVCIGNAPVALLELNRMFIEEGIQPALVIGIPVGFVHVEESKQELARLPIPSIILQGRRGGSALAVAALHVLAIQANVSKEI